MSIKIILHKSINLISFLYILPTYMYICLLDTLYVWKLSIHAWLWARNIRHFSTKKFQISSKGQYYGEDISQAKNRGKKRNFICTHIQALDILRQFVQLVVYKEFWILNLKADVWNRFNFSEVESMYSFKPWLFNKSQKPKTEKINDWRYYWNINIVVVKCHKKEPQK